MRSCPRCHAVFPSGEVDCPHDGTALVTLTALPAAPGHAATESLALSSPFDPLVPHGDLGESDAAARSDRGGSNASRPSFASGSASEELSAGGASARATRPGRPAAARATPTATAELTDHSVERARPVVVRAPPTPARPEDLVGSVIGSYRILEVIGKGGMGSVYRAEHVKLGREVALKLLRPEYAVRRDSVARFFQEARSVNKIRHRNIIDVTDFVELGDGTTFIVMELLPGISLGRLARTPGALNGPRALGILAQICDGLSAAHAVGIIHRDLKPDNILVLPEPTGGDLVKILDFGVAKLLHTEDDDSEEIGWQTAEGSVIGTPAFMSPEQAGGMEIDERSDVYSIGAIMYELFCGQPVFRASSFGEYVRKHLTEPPLPPSQTPGGRDLDDRLEAIILRCLAKSPDDRFPTAIDLRNALLDLLGQIETRMVTPGEIPLLGSSLLRTPSSLSSPRAIHAGGSTGGRPSVSRSGGFRGQAPPGDANADAELHSVSVPGFDTAMTLGDLPASRTTQSRASRLPLVLGAAALVAALAAVGFVIASRGDSTSSRARRVLARERAPRPATPPPEVTAMPVPAPMPAPGVAGPARRLVTVRFVSRPTGGAVYVLGAPAATCTTPCDVTIDPSDGGATDRRVYVVRRRGYADAPVVVDLAAPVATAEVTLHSGGGDGDSSGRPRPAAPTAAPASPEPTPPQPPTKPPEPPAAGDIDPSDTMDPFKPK